MNGRCRHGRVRVDTVAPATPRLFFVNLVTRSGPKSRRRQKPTARYGCEPVLHLLVLVGVPLELAAALAAVHLQQIRRSIHLEEPIGRFIRRQLLGRNRRKNVHKAKHKMVAPIEQIAVGILIDIGSLRVGRRPRPRRKQVDRYGRDRRPFVGQRRRLTLFIWLTKSMTQIQLNSAEKKTDNRFVGFQQFRLKQLKDASRLLPKKLPFGQ